MMRSWRSSPCWPSLRHLRDSARHPPGASAGAGSLREVVARRPRTAGGTAKDGPSSHEPPADDGHERLLCRERGDRPGCSEARAETSFPRKAGEPPIHRRCSWWEQSRARRRLGSADALRLTRHAATAPRRKERTRGTPRRLGPQRRDACRPQDALGGSAARSRSARARARWRLVVWPTEVVAVRLQSQCQRGGAVLRLVTRGGLRRATSPI